MVLRRSTPAQIRQRVPVMIKDDLTELCGNWHLQNDVRNTVCGTKLSGRWTGRRGDRRLPYPPPSFISQKAFEKSFCRSRFPHESVNLSLTWGMMNDKLTYLHMNGLVRFDSINTFWEIKMSGRWMGRRGDRRVSFPPYNFISQKMLIELFCKRQFPQKIVKLFLILVVIKDKSTDLCGNWPLQNNFLNILCEIKFPTKQLKTQSF